MIYDVVQSKDVTIADCCYLFCLLSSILFSDRIHMWWKSLLIIMCKWHPPVDDDDHVMHLLLPTPGSRDDWCFGWRIHHNESCDNFHWIIIRSWWKDFVVPLLALFHLKIMCIFWWWSLLILICESTHDDDLLIMIIIIIMKTDPRKMMTIPPFFSSILRLDSSSSCLSNTLLTTILFRDDSSSSRDLPSE